MIEKIIYKKKSGNCIARSDLSLRADQKKVVRHLDKHEQLLVVHGTGCGKTLSAVAISQCFLDAHPTYNEAIKEAALAVEKRPIHF